MKKILITGGAGFIGSHLAEALLGRGDEVAILDDLSTGSLANILDLNPDPRFTFALGSILDEARVDALVRECDEVYHLAAVVGVKLVFENPIQTIQVNVRGTEIVLEAALRYARKPLIVSTSEVYGKDVDPRHMKFRETDDLSLGTSLRWAYACSKALDEYLALSYQKKAGLPAVIVRIFNTVGPKQTGEYGMVLPRFAAQALAGRSLTVYGDGTQVRSFCWVKDTVAALMALMDAPAAVGEVFNVGSDEPVTILDLAERIKAKAGSSSPLEFVPYDQAYGKGFEDIRFRVPDTSKLQALVGFRPTITLDGIIGEVLASLRGR